jgi:2-polyprenyl-6-hydroxyphenyl methylase / 3-demethylubiquinone-9 3-methyltransferase
VAPILTRPRNDVGLYDDLADVWWNPQGAFAMLHWIAAARAQLVPPAPGPGARLVDLGCGGGLLAPFVAAQGYAHIGIDLTTSALLQARQHGVVVGRADVGALPLRSETADVVCAGEILEHVADLPGVVAEACRVLRPGGTLVIDTIAKTRLADLIAVRLAERVPGGAPAGVHDPALFVDRRILVAECSRHGVALRLRGMRPALPGLLAFLAKRRPAARMVPTWSTAVLFQAVGIKRK